MDEEFTTGRRRSGETDWPKRGRAAAAICAAAVLTLLAASCASFGSRKADDETPSAEAPAAQETSQDDPREKPERIEVEGAVDFRTEPYESLLFTLPEDGKPVFFASVPRRADREEEYEAGIDALAAQAARWKRARITAKFLTKKSSLEMGYIEEVEVDIDSELQSEMRDVIEVLVCYSDRSGSYLQGTLDRRAPEGLSLRDTPPGKKPEWILSPPEYEGYLTAVGAANRHMYLAESINAADEQALANLARQVNIEVEKKRLDLEREGATAYTEYTIQISKALLEGAYILDRWVSPNGNSYYSLAAAPRQ
jgi:hypothetical protein